MLDPVSKPKETPMSSEWGRRRVESRDKSEDEYVESRELERRRVCQVSPFESEDEYIESRDESEDEYVESRHLRAKMSISNLAMRAKTRMSSLAIT